MTREDRQAARLYTMGSAWTFDEAAVARHRLTAALDLLDRIERILDGDFSQNVCESCPGVHLAALRGCDEKSETERDVCRASAIRKALA